MRFPFFGVPVSVHWSFLIVALFGMGRYNNQWEAILAWTAAIFVAVLLHESGHAFTARSFGATEVAITLFALGGYTTWLPKPSIGPGKRFLISAAGSAVGIAVGLGILWFGRGGGYQDLPLWAVAFLETFVLVGLFWGVLNWIPLLPLDGGHMLQHGLAIVWPKQADGIARAVSVVVGVGLIGVAFYFRQPIMALFLIFILMSGLRARPASVGPAPPQQQAEPPPADPPAPRERDQEPPAFPI